MTNPPGRRLLVVTPAKDEAAYVRKTIASMTAQSWRPDRWVIVDDGSTDGTADIAEAAAREHPWITVVRRPKGSARRVGPGVVEAFYHGLGLYDLADFDYVCKLDADLEFGPDYFGTLLERFEADPRLGTASGKCWLPVGDGADRRLVLERTGDQFSHGTAKLYRRECFEEIGGFVRAVMWDGIDCHRCRMLGWKAVSYADESLRIVHLRQMGSSFRSVYHGRMRWGRGLYFMGTHPLYVLAAAAYRTAERPWVLGGLCILLGYVGAALRGTPRYDEPGFREHFRRWQFAELGRLIPWRRRRPSAALAGGV